MFESKNYRFGGLNLHLGPSAKLGSQDLIQLQSKVKNTKHVTQKLELSCKHIFTLLAIATFAKRSKSHVYNIINPKIQSNHHMHLKLTY